MKRRFSFICVYVCLLALFCLGAGELPFPDGGVRGHFFRERDAADRSGFENAAAPVAGGTHHALVFADGTVTVPGDTAAGLGDVSGWRLDVGRNGS